jgi:hypothetical protein
VSASLQLLERHNELPLRTAGSKRAYNHKDACACRTRCASCTNRRDFPIEGDESVAVVAVPQRQENDQQAPLQSPPQAEVSRRFAEQRPKGCGVIPSVPVPVMPSVPVPEVYEWSGVRLGARHLRPNNRDGLQPADDSADQPESLAALTPISSGWPSVSILMGSSRFRREP